MLTCPECGASRGLCTTSVYKLSTGERRRLRTCSHCGAKLRTIQAPGEAERLALEPIRERRRRRSTKLTADQVVEIREAIARGARPGSLAAAHGVSRQAIDQIASGQTWAHVGGPLRKPRRRPAAGDGPSCYRCQHWNDSCSMGFPDPEEEGPGFAADCGLYEVSQSISRACPSSVQ